MLKMQQIDNELQTIVGPETPLTDQDKNVTVKGILTHSAVFTQPNKNRRFLLINDSEKIECYAVTNSDLIDLEDWVNRRVFLRGDIKYDAFSKGRILFVDRVEEVKPMPITDAGGNCAWCKPSNTVVLRPTHQSSGSCSK